MRTIISEKRLREMLKKKLLKENLQLIEEDGVFHVPPSISSPVFTAVFSTGGTDFGQAFENITTQLLLQQGIFSNIKDLNPTGNSSEDGDPDTKTSEQNAILADVACDFQSLPAETIDDVSNMVLLSCKANKAAHNFKGPTEIKKLKDLLLASVLSNTLKEEEGDIVKAKFGAVHSSLNPVESITKRKIIYDVMVAYPDQPNLGYTDLTDKAKQTIKKSQIVLDSLVFKDRVLAPLILNKFGQVALRVVKGKTIDDIFINRGTGFEKFIKLINLFFKEGENLNEDVLEEIPKEKFYKDSSAKSFHDSKSLNVHNFNLAMKNAIEKMLLAFGKNYIDADIKEAAYTSLVSSTTFDVFIKTKIDVMVNNFIDNLSTNIENFNRSLNEAYNNNQNLMSINTSISSETALKTILDPVIINKDYIQLALNSNSIDQDTRDAYASLSKINLTSKGSIRKRMSGIGSSYFNLKSAPQEIEFLPDEIKLPKPGESKNDRFFRIVDYVMFDPDGLKDSDPNNYGDLKTKYKAYIADEQSLKEIKASLEELVTEIETQYIAGGGNSQQEFFEQRMVSTFGRRIAPKDIVYYDMTDIDSVIDGFVNSLISGLGGIITIEENSITKNRNNLAQGDVINVNLGQIRSLIEQHMLSQYQTLTSPGWEGDFSKIGRNIVNYVDSGRSSIDTQEPIDFDADSFISTNIDTIESTSNKYGNILTLGGLYKLDKDGKPLIEIDPDSESVADNFYLILNRYIKQVPYQFKYFKVCLTASGISFLPETERKKIEDTIREKAATEVDYQRMINNDDIINDVFALQYLDKVIGGQLAAQNPVTSRRRMRAFYSDIEQPPVFTAEELNILYTDLRRSLNELETILESLESEYSQEYSDALLEVLSGIVEKTKQRQPLSQREIQILNVLSDDKNIFESFEMANNDKNENLTDIKNKIDSFINDFKTNPTKFENKLEKLMVIVSNGQINESRLYNNVLKDIMEAAIKKRKSVKRK